MAAVWIKCMEFWSLKVIATLKIWSFKMVWKIELTDKEKCLITSEFATLKITKRISKYHWILEKSAEDPEWLMQIWKRQVEYVIPISYIKGEGIQNLSKFAKLWIFYVLWQGEVSKMTKHQVLKMRDWS